MREISFILNNETIHTVINPAVVVLDFIRQHERLTGTKEGCKEGDCGACTVLVGELSGHEVKYRSINSCLFPVANVEGMHVVTIEGLNLQNKDLNPIQQAFVDEGASQCGFCTPGFIVSLTGCFVYAGELNYEDAVDSMDGNICRCTGHNSIIRAAEKLTVRFGKDLHINQRIRYLIDNKIVPGYFLTIPAMLNKINKEKNSANGEGSKPSFFISGGTDLFVQKPGAMLNENAHFLYNDKTLKRIWTDDEYCHLGSAVSVTGIFESEIMNGYFPELRKFSELFGSTPIRNSATIGGNINNASPIGEMTAFFMSLNSNIVLSSSPPFTKRGQGGSRSIPLREFYTAYKTTQRRPDEYMTEINFKIPRGKYFYNFEKVSKRTYLDIASVNTGALITLTGNIISEAHISAGGVNAVPLYLEKTCDFLTGAELNSDTLIRAVEIADSEIAPINDARGSAEYKRLLLKRLLFTHFITLFPEIISVEQTI
jgi:xanthine dehydrogenase small subunit